MSRVIHLKKINLVEELVAGFRLQSQVYFCDCHIESSLQFCEVEWSPFGLPCWSVIPSSITIRRLLGRHNQYFAITWTYHQTLVPQSDPFA